MSQLTALLGYWGTTVLYLLSNPIKRLIERTLALCGSNIDLESLEHWKLSRHNTLLLWVKKYMA